MATTVNLSTPFFGPQLPRYPQLRQIVRASGTAVNGVAPGFLQQWNSINDLRDREPVMVWEPNGIAIGPGKYCGRLVGSYAGLPLIAISLRCCTAAGSFSFSSSSVSSSSRPSSSVSASSVSLISVSPASVSPSSRSQVSSSLPSASVPSISAASASSVSAASVPSPSVSAVLSSSRVSQASSLASALSSLSPSLPSSLASQASLLSSSSPPASSLLASSPAASKSSIITPSLSSVAAASSLASSSVSSRTAVLTTCCPNALPILIHATLNLGGGVVVLTYDGSQFWTVFGVALSCGFSIGLRFQCLGSNPASFAMDYTCTNGAFWSPLAINALTANCDPLNADFVGSLGGIFNNCGSCNGSGLTATVTV